MPPSSVAYSTRISVDTRLRRIVLGSGLGLLAAGVVVLACLPLAPPVIAAASGLWTAWVGRELAVLWRVYGRTPGYRLWADGAIDVLAGGGSGLSGRVAPGSLVTRRWAWLRIAASDGRCWGELVAGNGRESQQWRRFQVIFRHLSAC